MVFPESSLVMAMPGEYPFRDQCGSSFHFPAQAPGSNRCPKMYLSSLRQTPCGDDARRRIDRSLGAIIMKLHYGYRPFKVRESSNPATSSDHHHGVCSRSQYGENQSTSDLSPVCTVGPGERKRIRGKFPNLTSLPFPTSNPHANKRG